MNPHDADTETFRTAYHLGTPFLLAVEMVECDHWVAKPIVAQVREAIRVGREHGLTISISSAFRDMERQQELYRGWKENLNGFNPADPPGFSKHQDGTALDFAFKSEAEREEFAALAIAHGFTRPHSHEPWHFVVAPLPEKEVA